MRTGAKIIIGAALVVIMIYVILALDVGRVPEVTDFNTCAAAGNPVMESYPRQCRDAEGNLYTEDISIMGSSSKQ